MDEDRSEREDVGDAEAVSVLFEQKMAATQTFGIRLWWDGSERGGGS